MDGENKFPYTGPEAQNNAEYSNPDAELTEIEEEKVRQYLAEHSDADEATARQMVKLEMENEKSKE